MKKLLPLLASVVTLSIGPALHAISFDVYAQGNSSTGGIGLPTVTLNAGDWFQTSASTTDLWSAGALPRWSNADGLVADLLASGVDESGQAAGTLIGAVFPLWTQNGFTAPYGALIGQIGSSHVLLGTSFAGAAPESGTLQLWYWDSINSDNSNKVTVNVRVPDRGGFALALLASLALVGFHRFFGR